MDIFPVNHAKGDTNKYCGPSAISAVTRMASGEAARLIRATNPGIRAVKGTSAYAMARAFRACGIGMVTRLDNRGRETKDWPTLTQWLKNSQKHRTAGRVYLVAAGNHWVVISGRRFVCGITKQVVSIKHEKVARRARVETVHELVQERKMTIPHYARKPAHLTKTDPSYTELRKLLKEHGLKGKVEHDGTLKDYTIEPCALFPEGLTTLHHDWSETLDRIETCIAEPELVEDGGYYGR